jgi:ACT domain-containing protein
LKAELRAIEEMLMTCSTDQEIIKAVGISKSSYYRYKARIYKEHSERFNERRFINVGFYTEQLHNRLTKYLKILESRLESCNNHDTAALAIITVEVAKTIFDLNMQGLEILDTVRALDRKLVHTYEIDHANSSGINDNNGNGNGNSSDNNNTITYKLTDDKET